VIRQFGTIASCNLCSPHACKEVGAVYLCSTYLGGVIWTWVEECTNTRVAHLLQARGQHVCMYVCVG
jgi:hypothetical protein